MKDRLSEIIPDISFTGFGGWALGGEYWGPQEHRDSVRAIHAALNLGINHFDTAPVYGRGRSEQLLGQQLKKIRSRCVLATKAFYTDPEGIAKSFEISLKRLLTDYIDIFYIHWPKSGADMRPGMDLLEQYRREGRIRAIGVSNFSAEQIALVEEAGKVDVFQGGYNLFWPLLERSVLPFCREREIAFIPYGVLAQGILTDRWESRLTESLPGFRHKMILYRPEIRGRLLPVMEDLARECVRAGWSLENAATLYTAERTGAASVLLGVRSRPQAEKNFRLPGEPLPAELKRALDTAAGIVEPFLPDADNLFDHKS